MFAENISGDHVRFPSSRTPLFGGMIPSGMIIDAQDCHLQKYPQKLPSLHIHQELDGALLASQAVSHCWGQLEEPYLPMARDAKCIHLITSWPPDSKDSFIVASLLFPRVASMAALSPFGLAFTFSFSTRWRCHHPRNWRIDERCRTQNCWNLIVPQIGQLSSGLSDCFSECKVSVLS